MLEIEQFKPEHAELLCPTAIDDVLRSPDVDWRRQAEINAEGGPAYTGFYKDEIIGACGIRLLEDGGGWVWAIVSPSVKHCKKAAMRSILLMMRILIKKFELKYLITNSRKGFAASQRFLEHFGFERMKEETETYYSYKMVT